MWGVLVNGIQAAGLEHDLMRTANWSGAVSELFSAVFCERAQLNIAV